MLNLRVSVPLREDFRIRSLSKTPQDGNKPLKSPSKTGQRP